MNMLEGHALRTSKFKQAQCGGNGSSKLEDFEIRSEAGGNQIRSYRAGFSRA